MRAWGARYRVAYAAHYRVVLREAAEALRRLDAMRALGPPAGGAVLAAFAAAARTAEVTLGALPLSLAAVDAVRAALEQQRTRLAARTAHMVLARDEVPALDRLLQTITASDLGRIERVLDARLAAHIEVLLAVPVPAV